MAEKPSVRARRLTRGRVSARTGVNIETIRYYEQIGLLPAPPRTASGHRVYDDSHLRRLNFIRRCRDLGFRLEGVRSLLQLVDGGQYTCAEIKEMTMDHLKSVHSKISDLKVLETTLKEMVSQCDGGKVPECAVIDALFRDQRQISH